MIALKILVSTKRKGVVRDNPRVAGFHKKKVSSAATEINCFHKAVHPQDSFCSPALSFPQPNQIQEGFPFGAFIAPVFKNKRYSLCISAYTPYLLEKYFCLASTSKKSFSELLSLHFLLFVFIPISASSDTSYTIWEPWITPVLEFCQKWSLFFHSFCCFWMICRRKRKNVDLHNHIYSRCTQCLNY